MRTNNIQKVLGLLIFTLIISVLLGFSEVRTASATGIGTTITVTFHGNGGETDTYDMVAVYGDTYGPLPLATRDNYEFVGWYTYASGGTKITEKSKVVKPLNHTLYARWRGEQTEITLEPDGGTLKSNTVKVYFGTKFSNQLPTPVKEDSIFTGWYTALTGGEKVTVKSIFTEKSPTTLYARWTQKTVKVIFISFSGEPFEMEVYNGLPFGDLPEPEKENCIFGGWYKFRDYTSNSAQPITAETIVNEVGQIKLFARWYFDPGTTE